MNRTYHSLQILRGLACLLVVAYHVAGAEFACGLGFNLLRPLLWFGYTGVDLFFVLSGFIITATNRADFGRPSQLPRYAFRRAWRIYPTYWAALAIGIGVYAYLVPSPILCNGWAGEFCKTILLAPPPTHGRFLPVAWTLIYEVFFYLAFALLFLVPRRAAGPLLVAWAGVVVCATLAGLKPANHFAAIAISPFVLEFLAGAAIAWWTPALGGRRAALITAAAISWCAAGSWMAYHPNWSYLATNEVRRVVIFGPASALVVLAVAGWDRGGGRLSWTWMERIGDSSYSIYLVHCSIIAMIMGLSVHAGWSHNRLPHTAWIVVMLSATVTGGLLLHYAFEAPLMRLVKRKRTAPRPESQCANDDVPIRIAA